MELTQYQDLTRKDFPGISQVLEAVLRGKERRHRIRQKSTDLRRIVGTALDRNRKNTSFNKSS